MPALWHRLTHPPVSRLPVLVALFSLLIGGWWLLHHSDQQARDTIRKHHLADMEQALFTARQLHGTYPPYDQATWCGRLTDPKNEAVRAEVETALRAQNEKYANPAKPFPVDPRFANTPQDYFYWKRSPASMQLAARLEAAPTGEFSTVACPGSENVAYDYGITSVNREDLVNVNP